MCTADCTCRWQCGTGDCGDGSLPCPATALSTLVSFMCCILSEAFRNGLWLRCLLSVRPGARKHTLVLGRCVLQVDLMQLRWL